MIEGYGSGPLPLINGSGSRSPKNIRIRNADFCECRNGKCTVVYCGEGVVSHEASLPLATTILKLAAPQALVIPLTARHSRYGTPLA
jgi:hypothetical protein